MLGRYLVAPLGCQIPVVNDFRYLGAHINTGGGRRAATLDARVHKGLGRLSRIGRLGAGTREKATAIRVKVHSGTFYWIEGSDMTDKQVASLSTAIIDVFKTRNNRHDVDWFCTTCSKGRDLDPQQ